MHQGENDATANRVGWNSDTDSASEDTDVLIGEFVGEIGEMLATLEQMCACLHAPWPEPWSPAQHRTIEIVENALRGALAAIKQVGIPTPR